MSEFESPGESIITNADYQLVESNDIEFYGVKLLTGKWKDVLYIYGKVSIKESPELDIATLAFTYDIQEAGQFEESELIGDIDFRNYIGGILQNIMEESLDTGKVIGKIGHNNTNTNTRT
mgnify:CR=1 FL=1|jgi:hypothetical protein|tara:strand:+ start:214 stop:573 length:360 start_codon:yes stop_codon:yes gene_type:complete